ncbi:MAG: saccharopine dehydrogenase family protein [Chloroflexota bacterium]
MPAYHYLILGAGRQGTAAAYDLAQFGQAATVTLADLDRAAPERAAARVNRLTGTRLARPLVLDVADSQAVAQALQGVDVALSAVPYRFNLALTQAAIRAGVHFCDLGGNTPIVRAQLALDEQAKQAGVSVIPDCGMGPGLVNTLAAYAMELLEEAQEVYIYDAGLPQRPEPPWNYQLTFHINGLTNEMDGEAIFIRNGQIVHVPTLSEPEWIEFPGLGCLEADVTSGGTSLAAWTYLGKLQRFENKVLRYPGHYEWLRAYKALGLFSETPVEVNGQRIIPRQVYHTLLEPKISAAEIRDICVMRAVGKGKKNGHAATVTIDLVDRYDEATGFTGMERLTGWHASVMMGFQARGEVPSGGVPVELAVPAGKFIQALHQRGIYAEVRFSFGGSAPSV